jgi:hypothetical protein
MILKEETIEWIDVLSELPDDSISVLIIGREDQDDINTFMWIGYWDSADDCWRSSDGSIIDEVTYWADMPIGPRVIQ